MKQGGNTGSKGTTSKKDQVTQNPVYTDIFSAQSSKSNASLYSPQVELKSRGFIGSSMRPMLYTPQMPSSNQKLGEVQTSSDFSPSNQVFWGTNINLEETLSKFRQFLLNFKVEEEGGQSENYYHRMLKEINETKYYILNIDGNHLKKFDKMLYWQLLNFPNDMIPVMDSVVNRVYEEILKDNLKQDKQTEYIQVRISNLVKKDRIRDLGPENIDKLVSISGIVIRTSEIIPEMREACFKCTVCGHEEEIQLIRNVITEPIDCPVCKCKSSFDLIHNRSSFNDRQHLKVQETPETMPEGETPVTLHLCAYDELVDFVKPGDRCEFVGIFRAQGVRVNPRTRVTKTTFRTYIDVVSINKYNKNKMNIDDDDGIINEEGYGTNELEEIYKDEILKEVNELKKNKDIYNILVESIAPNIWENEDVKKGLLLQLFGGVSKDFSSSGRGKFRGDINVLLVGDPSTAKSQLLQYVHNLAPRGIYTSGKGSSVVGLTAYVTKDPETRELILESGALVLSDRGICCIDEFDKMDDSTKVILHEAMEQQTISIAKAGIICQLNARAAILASANPINSKYNPKLSVVQNIRLPPSLLSRFDLIYLMLDKHNDVYDRRLANHIVSLYGALSLEEEDSSLKKIFVRKEVLTAYISQAKKFNPKISDEIVGELAQLYNSMRQMSTKNTISATPRQLESLIRLSEARARCRFSEYIMKEDVEEAIRLIRVATQQAATDPTTGVIDMDLISTGMTTSSRTKMTQLKDIIRTILRDFSETARRGVKYSSLLEETKKRVNDRGQSSFDFSDFEFKDSLKLLEDEGVISLLGNRKAPTVRLIAQEI